MNGTARTDRRRSLMTVTTVLPALLLLAACGDGDAVVVPQSASATSGSASSAVDASSATSPAAGRPAPAASDPAGAPAQGGQGVQGGLDVTPGALGPARVGTPVAAFAAALGRRVRPAARGEGDSKCWVLGLTDLPKVTVMVLGTVKGPVRRVDVANPRIRTATGVGIGSTERQVMAAYPGAVKSGPNKYVEGGQYLLVSEQGHDLVFETDAKQVVTLYRFGDPEQVSWVESCA